MAWRWDAHGDDGSVMPVGYHIAAVAGALMLMVSAYIGGTLVYQHGMGIDARPAASSPASPAEASSSSGTGG
jgi:uncharacterized membrane protein